MSARTHDVELRLGPTRQRLDALDELTLTQDLLAPGSPTTVTLWRPPNAAPWPESDLYALARIYTPAEVWIDGALQVRGVVEKRSVHADHRGAQLRVTFRDLTGAGQVADADPRRSLRNVTLERALQILWVPTGLDVTVGASATEARRTLAGMRPGARVSTARKSRRAHHVDRFRIQPGQKIMQVSDALCRRHGYLLYTAPYGEGVGLVIDRPAYDSPVLYQLTRKRQADGTSRGNLLAGGHELDALQLPTEITITGHTHGTAREDAYHRITVANDRLTGPHLAAEFAPRPWYRRDARGHTPQLATQRARREMARANAAFDVYSATVQGWSQGRGPWLYAVNCMARIDDDETGVRGDWLVTQVTFRRSRGSGTTTDLRLVPKGALVIEPDPEA